MHTSNSSRAHCPAEDLINALRQLSVETREFMPCPIDVLHAPVDPCTFLRRYVATNTPVLIRGATEHWPASQLWSQEYLCRKAGATTISVELTPNGFGDAVTAYETASGTKGECFCMPCSTRMQLQQFTDRFFQTKQNASAPSQGRQIPYLSVGLSAGAGEGRLHSVLLRLPCHRLHCLPCCSCVQDAPTCTCACLNCCWC